jgi:hypothetical protein
VSARWAASRVVVFVLPAAAAALLRLSVDVVAALGLLAVVGMLMAVGSRLSEGDTMSRRSRWAAAARVRRPPPARPPRDLERMGTLVAGRIPTAVGTHQWLRPLMADIAATRLRVAHGVELTDPAAPQLVPEPLWELIRPGRPEPLDRHAAGLTAQEMTVLVDQLEAL